MSKKQPDVKFVPSTPQKNSYSCGAAVTQAAAQYFGYWTRQDDLTEALGTSPKKGTSPNAIIKFLKKLGLKAEIKTGTTIQDLTKLAEEDHTIVIVNFQAWGEKKDYSETWEDGHYAVLLGVRGDNVYFRDPSLIGGIGYVTKDDLMKRWRDYETEGGKRVEYKQMCIIVRGKENLPPQVSKIE